MESLVYYAVFEPSANGSYGVYWPDFPGCTSFGMSFRQAEAMAAEALEMHIDGMEQDGDALPPVSRPPFDGISAGSLVVPIAFQARAARSTSRP
jgi:predicted RNase H-like HicB family nuclease